MKLYERCGRHNEARAGFDGTVKRALRLMMKGAYKMSPLAWAGVILVILALVLGVCIFGTVPREEP